MDEADRTHDDELALCAEMIGEFPELLRPPETTIVPSDFPTLWNDLRAAVDGSGDPSHMHELLLRLPTAISDPGSPTYFGYIPNSADPIARVVDAYLSLVNPVAAGPVDGYGFIAAEHAATDKVGELAGLPSASRGGTFVQGGTLGNFCALAAARGRWRAHGQGARPIVLGSHHAHSSIRLASHLLDLEFIPVDVDRSGKLALDGLAAAVAHHGTDLVAIVGNAGTTTAGAVDDLTALGDCASRSGAWLHVDGAYGGAVLFSDRHRALLDGIEAADSIVVDPHKWLFCPYDSSMLIYRDASEVTESLGIFTQAAEDDASYLDFGERHNPKNDLPRQVDVELGELALQLSRRARGVTFWALLASLGVEGLGEKVDATVETVHHAYEHAVERGVETPIVPQLSVLLLGQSAWPTIGDWDSQWVRPAFERGMFVSTDKWAGRPVGRLCVTNPHVTPGALEELVDMVAKASPAG